jgi:hypothetical protein
MLFNILNDTIASSTACYFSVNSKNCMLTRKQRIIGYLWQAMAFTKTVRNKITKLNLLQVN